MNAIISALLGVSLYGFVNAIVELRLKQYPTISLLLGWYAVLFPAVLLLYVQQKHAGIPMTLPKGMDLFFLIFTALLFFLADFFYLGAFSFKGSNATTIAILFVFLPVVTAAVKFVLNREAPTLYHIGAFVLAVGAIALTAYGNAQVKA